MQTPLRKRKHQKSHQTISQPQHEQVQPDLVALPQASSSFGGIDSTVLPPPSPPPCIVNVIPRSGPHSTNERVWVTVVNLPRSNGEQYCIEFGHGVLRYLPSPPTSGHFRPSDQSGPLPIRPVLFASASRHDSLTLCLAPFHAYYPAHLSIHHMSDIPLPSHPSPPSFL